MDPCATPVYASVQDVQTMLAGKLCHMRWAVGSAFLHGVAAGGFVVIVAWMFMARCCVMPSMAILGQYYFVRVTHPLPCITA